MSIERPPRARAAVAALLVFAGYSLWFSWLFSAPLLRNAYAAESGPYEYSLPIFLAPITTWSSFEFSGLPAFAEPGDFTTYPLHYLFARAAVDTYYATALYAVATTWGRPTARFHTSIAAMFAISMRVAAHKALPLVDASRVMARQLVNYGQFAGHANTPAEMLSVLFPTALHDGREAPTDVGLATVAFALVGVSRARIDRRAMFWVAAALFAWRPARSGTRCSRTKAVSRR